MQASKTPRNDERIIALEKEVTELKERLQRLERLLTVKPNEKGIASRLFDLEDTSRTAED